MFGLMFFQIILDRISPLDNPRDFAVWIYSSVINSVAFERIPNSFSKIKIVAKTNSASNDSGNAIFRRRAKKKNEKYLKGADIFLIPLYFKQTDKNIFIPTSRIKIATNIAGKIIAVVSKNPLSKLYSLHNEIKDSNNSDGLGNRL
jgi:hypothetical protein